MTTLKLATDLSLPLDAVTQTFLVVGKRGSGKSNTAARVVEQLHRAGLPFVVLDPVDTWWGLKATRAGGRGLDVYVFGGAHQDLPLEAAGGALLAEVLCEHRTSMVLSVKHLSGRERSRFMVAFAQTLFQKWRGGPLFVVLEEAHELAPQMAARGGGDADGEGAMLGAFKRLWKLGRASGIGGMAVTQRPASLSKDITTQSEVLIAHRTIGPQDVKAIGEWVRFHGEQLAMLGELPTLPTGEAFVWAPEFPEGAPIGLRRTTVLRRETFDSASTPKVGERRVEPRELAPVDLERLRTKMAATLEKAKAEDPRELRKQLAEKDRELADLRRSAERAPAATVQKRTDVLTDADRELLRKLGASLEEMAQELGTRSGAFLAGLEERLETGVRAVVDRILTEARSEGERVHEQGRQVFEKRLEAKGFQRVLEKLAAVSPSPPPVGHPARPGNTTPARLSGRAAAPAPRSRPPAAAASAEGVTPVGQRILDALAELEQLGVATPSREMVAFLAGYTHLQSKGLVNGLGALRSAGLIEYPSSGAVALTTAGQAAAFYRAAPRSAGEVQHRIITLLGGASGRVLTPLIACYPAAMPRERLAAAAGYGHLQSKGFVNAIGRLRTLGFIDYPDRGTVVAKSVLFLQEG